MSKRSTFICCALFFCCYSEHLFAQKKIVVLGSSTAAGSGASNYSNAWVGKYSTYITTLNGGHSLANLAIGGYNTYQILPTGTPHPGRPGQDTLRNITAAIVNFAADIVIVNMPSNDVANSYDVSETLLNYRRIKAYCDLAGVVVYFTTTQPRNFTDVGKLGQLMQIKDSTVAQYGNFSIDFWNGIANPDGTIIPTFNADGIHVNDSGHEIFFQRVKAKPIMGLNTLPVVLKDFNASSTALGVLLEWKLSGNGERPLIEIQKSDDGSLFANAGIISSSINERYSFVDSKPFNGINYYRLKLTTSNSVKYSAIVSVWTEKKSGISIFPNPVERNELHFQLYQPQDKNVLLRIYSVSGTEKYRQTLQVKKGTSLYSVFMPQVLQKGIYYVSISGENGNRQIFLVQ